MAGKRQHIIPRFLMKGFASRFDGDEVFTWVYRKGAPPFEGNTKNINVERYFYGKEGEELYADGVITNLERDRFSPLVDELRNKEGSVDFLSLKIADFISNTIVRTKNFRNSFFEMSENISQRLDEYLAASKNLEKIILNQPIFIRNEFEKFWQENIDPLIQENLELLKSQGNDATKISKEKEKLFQRFLKEFPKQIKTDLPEFSEGLSKVFSEIKNTLPNIIKEGHIKHIKQKPISENKIEDYLQLKWFVISTQLPLILGDAGCIFEVIGKRRFKTFDDSSENLINALLPLSANKILIGTKYQTVPNINVKLLNKATAFCSYDLFISSEKTPDKSKLSDSIGEWAFLLKDEELEFYINQMFRDLELTDSLTKSIEK